MFKIPDSVGNCDKFERFVGERHVQAVGCHEFNFLSVFGFRLRTVFLPGNVNHLLANVDAYNFAGFSLRFSSKAKSPVPVATSRMRQPVQAECFFSMLTALRRHSLSMPKVIIRFITSYAGAIELNMLLTCCVFGRLSSKYGLTFSAFISMVVQAVQGTCYLRDSK